MQIDRYGNVNVSRLAARPHVTAGVGGFVDITAHARNIVFSGYFTAGGLKISLEDGQVSILKEGKARKFVQDVEQISFSGKRAIEQKQNIIYITERCVIRLLDEGLTVTEIAPGIDLERDVLGQADIELAVSEDLKLMDPAALFNPNPMNLEL